MSFNDILNKALKLRKLSVSSDSCRDMRPNQEVSMKSAGFHTLQSTC